MNDIATSAAVAASPDLEPFVERAKIRERLAQLKREQAAARIKGNEAQRLHQQMSLRVLACQGAIDELDRLLGNVVPAATHRGGEIVESPNPGAD